jgi:hypothetical protein
MLDVKIEYRKRIYHYNHPEKYNELTRDQYLSVVRFFLVPEKPFHERITDRITLMQDLLNLHIETTFKGRWYKVVNSMVEDGIIDELLKLQSFLFVKQDFNSWILKKLELKNKSFYGPRDRFSNMTFGQFIYADMMFMAYFDSQDELVLNKFFAALYLEGEKEEFSTDRANERVESLSQLSLFEKKGIVFNYANVRQWISEKYKFVFPEKDDKTTNEIHFGKHQGGWMSIRRNLAGDVLNLEKIDKVLLHDVLGDLNEKMSKQ